MQHSRLLQKGLLATVFFLSGFWASAQVLVSGTIYDETQRFALRGVSVMGTSGIGTVTDSLGHYNIKLPLTDSIYFSYLGRETLKLPVSALTPGYPLDMSMQVAIDSLPTVLVRPRNYYLDSLENRKEYEKVFNYGGASYLDNMKMKQRGGVGVGIDLDMIFDGKKAKQIERLQKRLVEEEQDKYVDHRWNKPLVRKITGLEPPALDTFMRQYRPSYEFIQSCETEYEFYHYIQEWGKLFDGDWKNAHPEAKQ